MEECGIVFMTAPSRDEAERIAACLVEKKLAACVQIASEITSLYRWKGKLCRAGEWLLMAKTTAALFDELASEVTSMHSYEVPEIVYVPVEKGMDEYLTWIVDTTKK